MRIGNNVKGNMAVILVNVIPRHWPRWLERSCRLQCAPFCNEARFLTATLNTTCTDHVI